MNAYQRSVELGLTGTDAEIVAKLKPLTVSNIPVRSVRTWFREQNLWLERSTGGMMGPLQVAYDAASQQEKDGLDYLYDTVFAGSAEFLRTTDPVWAARVYDLVQLVVSLSPQVSGLIDSFYALDGGRPYKDLTVQQYQQQKAEAEQEQEQQFFLTSLQTRFDALKNKIGTVEQSDAADELEAMAAEVRAR